VDYTLIIERADEVTLRGLDEELLPHICDASQYIVDLSGLRYIELPNAVYLLLLIGYLKERSGQKPLLVPPDNENVLSFLTNMKFFVLAENHSLCTQAINLAPGHVEQALEIKYLPAALTPEGIENSLTYIQQNTIIDKLVDLGAGQFAGLATPFRELARNVHEHSGSYGYIAAQLEPKVADAQRFHLAVGDLGIGIQRSLAPFYESNQRRFERAFGPVWDEAKALDVAFAPGVSSKAKQDLADDERGVGLWTVLQQVKEARGAIVCRTGHNKVFMGFFRGKWRTQRKTDLSCFPGTQLDVVIPLDRKRG
jgi:hypothetical protein